LGIAIPPWGRKIPLQDFVQDEFEQGLGIERWLFGVTIKEKERRQIELFNECADKPNGMIGRKLLVDFFSIRRLDNRASEKK
jgi:hypothetical protein